MVPFLVTMDKYESNILNTSTQCKNSPFPKCQTNCGHRSSAIASEISTSSSRVELPALLFPALEVFVEYDNIFSINADIRGDYTVFAFETKRERERERERDGERSADRHARPRPSRRDMSRERERERENKTKENPRQIHAPRQTSAPSSPLSPCFPVSLSLSLSLVCVCVPRDLSSFLVPRVHAHEERKKERKKEKEKERFSALALWRVFVRWELWQCARASFLLVCVGYLFPFWVRSINNKTLNYKKCLYPLE